MPYGDDLGGFTNASGLDTEQANDSRLDVIDAVHRRHLRLEDFSQFVHDLRVAP